MKDIKFIQIEELALLQLIQIQDETGYDLVTLISAAVNCASAYFDDEVIKVLIDNYLEGE